LRRALQWSEGDWRRFGCCRWCDRQSGGSLR
jgi:hypothetical protein